MPVPGARNLALAAIPLVAGCVPVLTSPQDTGGSAWTAPENSWPVSTPPDDLVGEGYGQGQVFPDFLLMDQHGDPVSMWQFYGNVVVVDVSTMWCGPCAELADHVDETWADYKSQGFMYLTLLPEDNVAEVPDLEDLQRWASDHSITAPVLSDDAGISALITPNGEYPAIMVIDRDMTVAEDRVNPADDATIRALVESLL